MNYTFPFSTCEQPSKPIAQPISSLLGLISICILVSFLVTTRYSEAQFIIGLFLLFEIVHTWSHAYHIPGKIQVIMIHLIAYAILSSYLWMFYSRYNVGNPWIMAAICIVIGIDLIFFISRFPFIYYFISMSIAFLLVFFNYYPRIPSKFHPIVNRIIATALIIILLILNEVYNCEAMMKWRVLPYHALVEIAVCVILYFICIFITRFVATVKKKRLSFKLI